MAIAPSAGVSAYDRWQALMQGAGQSGQPALPTTLGTPAPTPQPAPTRLQGRNLIFGAGDSLKLSLPQLDADLIDLTPADPLNLDDRAGYRMHIRGGEVMLTDGQITNLLRAELGGNKQVRDLQIRFLPNNQLQVTAKLTGLGLPISATADIRNDEQGHIAIVPTKIKVAGISALPIAKTFGLNFEKLAKFKDDKGRFGLSGNNVWIDPGKLSEAPAIDGKVNMVRTDQGFLSIYMGDVSPSRPLWLPYDGNYATITGGSIINGGQRVDNPTILLRDKTPYDPFNMDDENGRTTTVVHGNVTIPGTQLRTMLEGAVGSGGDFNLSDVTMTSDGAKVKGTFKGFLPVQIYIRFDKSNDGSLKVVPHSGKVSFIPIPDGLLRKLIGGMLDGAKPEGNGFVLGPDMLGSTQLGKLLAVRNEPGALKLDL
jgi:hypothetical protein